MRGLKVSCLALSAFAVAGGLRAADAKTYVKLKVNQSETAYWDGSQWEDGAVPDSTKDYIVNGWFGIYPSSRSATDSSTSRENPLAFPGNSLTLGDGTGTGGFSARLAGTSYYSFPREGLIGNRGNLSLYNTYQTTYFLGTITVQTKNTATESNTFTFNIGNKYYSHMHVEAKVKSAADCRANVTGTRAPQTVYFEGDMSEFNGELNVISPTVTLNTTFATEMPGTLSCATNAELTTSAATDIVRVGGLSLADGTVFKLKTDANNGTNAQYVVSGDVLTKGKVHVVASDYFTRSGTKAKPDGKPWETAGTPWRSPFITAPKGKIDKDAFVFDQFENTHNTSDGSIFYRGFFNAHFELVENSDGETETLYFVQEPIVVCICTVNPGNAYSVSGFNEYSPCTNAADWSDGELPHAGANYLVKYLTTAQSPDGATHTPIFVTPQDVDDYVFPGESLTLGNANGHIASRKSASFKRLRMIAGRLFFYRDDFELKGGVLEIVPTDGGTFFYATEDKRVKVLLDLVGDGLLQVGGQATYGGWTVGGETEFCGDNSGFTGRLVLTSWPRGGNYKPTGNYPFTGERVYLHAASDLGGTLTEFGYDAVTLSEYASLRPCESMTLADASRGVLVSGKGDITVAGGITLSVATPMTYAGELTKGGTGVLALGVKPRFTDGGEATAPTADQNVLLVKEGYVRADVPQALDNLAITVSDGAGLAFSAKPSGGVAATGLELANVSIAAEGKVAVALDPTTFDETEVTVPLFTGTRAQVNAMLAKCRFVRPTRGWGSELVFSGTDDRLTVSAKYHPVGMLLLFR